MEDSELEQLAEDIFVGTLNFYPESINYGEASEGGHFAITTDGLVTMILNDESLMIGFNTNASPDGPNKVNNFQKTLFVEIPLDESFNNVLVLDIYHAMRMVSMGIVRRQINSWEDIGPIIENVFDEHNGIDLDKRYEYAMNTKDRIIAKGGVFKGFLTKKPIEEKENANVDFNDIKAILMEYKGIRLGIDTSSGYIGVINQNNLWVNWFLRLHGKKSEYCLDTIADAINTEGIMSIKTNKRFVDAVNKVVDKVILSVYPFMVFPERGLDDDADTINEINGVI